MEEAAAPVEVPEVPGEVKAAVEMPVIPEVPALGLKSDSQAATPAAELPVQPAEVPAEPAKNPEPAPAVNQ